MRFALTLLLLTGCASRDLKWQVAALDAQIAMMNQRIAALEANSGTPAKSQNELEASALYETANAAYLALDFATARELFEQLTAKHPETQAARRAARLITELSVIGVDEGDFTVQEWIQGSAEPGAEGLAVLVFFEQWCPHCRREVPELERKSKKWSERGVSVIGFTRLSRSSTLENTKELLEKNKVSYPVAIETGDLSERYKISGIPAAVITSKGKVVWRGHPARIDETLIESLMAEPAPE